MGRILAIDYGTKRTGIAVTDPLRIIATPLETVPTGELLTFLTAYLQKEQVDEFVIGMPKTLRNEDSQIAPAVRSFITKLKATFPDKNVAEVDERFTSSIALDTVAKSGLKRKDRQDKARVDRLSATLILQTYLQTASGTGNAQNSSH